MLSPTAISRPTPTNSEPAVLPGISQPSPNAQAAPSPSASRNTGNASITSMMRESTVSQAPR